MPNKQQAEATRRLLADLWEKNLPVLRARLNLLDSAAASAAAGSLTAEQRKEAGSTAHKLAGSLGMFGYPKGTELSRVLELSFDSDRPLREVDIASQVTALRNELGA